MIEISNVIPIPVPISPLIGRDADLAHLCEMVTGGARLVTITGIGGIGKTRLATQVALELEPSFEHGAMLVPLSQIRHADLIAETIGNLLGQRIPAGDTTATAAALGEGTRLLVLDNLEQIPEAGDYLSQLLTTHDGVTLLVTSQVPLRITDEQVYSLGPMAVPVTDNDHEHLQENPSVQLFIQRAQSIDHEVHFNEADLAIVAKICARLEGIPLAIELAAARLVALPPAALLERLGSRFDVLGGGSPHVDDRLRTMRNAVAWSYDLLTTEEQQVFRFLGVYAGNISLEAVEHTLSTLEIPVTPWELIDSFLSRSLLQKTQGGKTPGYRMLQTLRDFAHDQLEVEGEVFAAHLAHAAWVVEFAEQAQPHIRGQHQAEWLRRLDADADNIRTTIEWAAEHNPEYAMRMIATLWPYLESSGKSEYYSRRGSAIDTSSVPTPVLATGLLGIGSMYSRTGRDPDHAREILQRAITLANNVGDQRTVGRSHNALGGIERNLGNLNAAQAHYQEATDIARDMGNEPDLAAALGNLGLVAFDRNDMETARKRLLEVLTIAEDTGNMAQISQVRMTLGIFANRVGDYESAYEDLKAALAIFRESGNTYNEFYVLMNIINSAIGLGDFASATSYYEEGLANARRSGSISQEVEVRTSHLEVALQTGDFQAAAGEIEIIANACENESFMDVFITVAGIAMDLAFRQNRLEHAAALLGGHSGWQEKTELRRDNRILDNVARISAVIPEDPASPLRLAYMKGREWTAEELRLATLRAARRYRRHTMHLSPPAVEPVYQPRFALTPREFEVLALLSSGKSNIDIAEEMFISHRTISTHVSNILGKLNVPNRAAAVALALNEGLVAP